MINSQKKRRAPRGGLEAGTQNLDGSYWTSPTTKRASSQASAPPGPQQIFDEKKLQSIEEETASLYSAFSGDVEQLRDLINNRLSPCNSCSTDRSFSLWRVASIKRNGCAVTVELACDRGHVRFWSSSVSLPDTSLRVNRMTLATSYLTGMHRENSLLSLRSLGYNVDETIYADTIHMLQPFIIEEQQRVIEQNAQRVKAALRVQELESRLERRRPCPSGSTSSTTGPSALSAPLSMRRRSS